MELRRLTTIWNPYLQKSILIEQTWTIHYKIGVKPFL